MDGAPPHPASRCQQPQHASPPTRLLPLPVAPRPQATISVRERGSPEPSFHRQWEHALVRYRASWGWPNFCSVEVLGWDPAAFDNFVVDGKLLFSAFVKVLG